MPATPIAQLAPIDYVVMAVYFVAVLGVGWGLRRLTRTSTDFFLSGRSLPAWITGLAFISANLGAQEVIGGLFTVLGLLLTGYGVATAGDATRYARSFAVNVNLWWGLVMLFFGVLLLWSARRGWGRGSARPALEEREGREGRETEERERSLGLEH